MGMALLLIQFAYPAKVSQSEEFPSKAPVASLASSGAADIVRVLKIPGVASLLTFKGGVCVGGGFIFCMLQQFAMDPFGFTTSQTSLLMAYLGFVQLVAQGIIVPMFGNRSSARSLQFGTVV